MNHFTGWLARREEDEITCELQSLDEAILDDLPVSVEVLYSGINYKDALALHGKPGVLRRFPLIPGIDLTGTVTDSQDPRWQPGDVVTLTGAGLGEQLHGGLAQRARVEADALIRVPEAFSPYEVAAIGTAGFTAALCVEAIAAHVEPGQGPIVVTGASGGVGSIGVALLAAAGYEVVAATGRVDEQAAALKQLGAASVIDRAELTESGKPLQAERWAGALDAIGGDYLVGILASARHDGVVTACGLAASPKLPTTVLPFILRGVSLIGINSVVVTAERRAAAWKRLARDLEPSVLREITTSVSLADAQKAAAALLEGQGTGRIVVDVNAEA